MRLAVIFGPCVQMACLWVLKSPDGPASEKLGFRAGGGKWPVGGRSWLRYERGRRTCAQVSGSVPCLPLWLLNP